ncbi:biopolymer transporter ExbD [Flavobacterium amniphilum]|uniref:ExbD/TolR family protein n=1 Tax=Flavobacterium amniphilum TaxID=1834035 RepID=UPI00202A1784|nr:biopolymer transporter ExbD [Flavobacterium amniphilum]MCL9804419.1 biopolymer transporter ExbD [Flavobacterium amniphilum]
MEERRNNFGRIAGKIRTKKLKARVDLTAMVSVSFLLIVFFMLTSYLSRPQAVDLKLPDADRIVCGIPNPGCLNSDRVMTLLLDDHDRVVSYLGNFENPLEAPKEFNSATESLTKELTDRNQYVQNTLYGDPKKGLIVLVKPSKDSNYGNLVNVLDGLGEAEIKYHTIANITPEEMQLLAKN